jgi:hypothetical protein
MNNDLLSDITNSSPIMSPLHLPSILAKRAVLKLDSIDIESSPSRSKNKRKVTCFAEVIPIKMNSFKSLNSIEEIEEINGKPPNRKMTFHSPTRKFNSGLPVRKLTSLAPSRKMTSNSLNRGDLSDFKKNSNLIDNIRKERLSNMDLIHQKIKEMGNEKTDMKRIHIKSVFSKMTSFDKPDDDNIEIEIPKEVINSPIKSLRTYLHKNTNSVKEVNKKEKEYNSKLSHSKLIPIMQIRKREILIIASK